jgi:hypothetical protein
MVETFRYYKGEIMDNNSKSSATVGLPTFLLFLLFLGLKLGKVIDWSWWWITSPLWIPIVLTLGIGLIVYALAAIATKK